MTLQLITALSPLVVEIVRTVSAQLGVEQKCKDCDALHAMAVHALEKSSEARKRGLDTPASGNRRQRASRAKA